MQYIPHPVTSIIAGDGIQIDRPTGDVTITAPGTGGPTTTQTLSNKRIKNRVLTVNAPGATPAINTDNCDVAAFTGLATAITSLTTNLTGTPDYDDALIIELTDDGTGRAFTMGVKFSTTNRGPAYPTTTVAGQRLRLGHLFNGSTWDLVAVA